jgi:alpha-galactosidase
LTIKISIVGAGSATFSLPLIKDLCLTPNLEGSTLSLMDIDEERLDAVHSLCRRYAGEVGAELDIQKTQHREESLTDASFVIDAAMAYPPGYHVVQEGWSIALKHGYRFGDSHHIMEDGFWLDHYQFELFDSLANSIMDRCPSAWYIQVANPILQGITYLGRRYEKLKCVGLCHGFRGVFDLSRTLGLKEDEITFQAPGLNHFIWLTRFRHGEEDAYPLLDKWIDRDAPRYWETCGNSDKLGPVPVDLYHRFGVFPIGDTCTPGGGSWPWWYHTNAATEARWKVDPKGWWHGYFLGTGRKTKEMIKLSADHEAKVTERYPPVKTTEAVVPLVESLACDLPRTLQVNLQNSGGFVAGIPRDFEVEVPAHVSGKGIKALKTDRLPGSVLSFALRDRVAPVEVELEAYETGSRERLLDLVMMDPWTRSRGQAEGLLEDILAMPYHGAMRDHYT